MRRVGIEADADGGAGERGLKGVASVMVARDRRAGQGKAGEEFEKMRILGRFAEFDETAGEEHEVGSGQERLDSRQDRRQGDEEVIDNFWQDANHVRGIWRTTSVESYGTAEPVWETILDIDALAASEGKNWVYKGASCLPPEERLVAAMQKLGVDFANLSEVAGHA